MALSLDIIVLWELREGAKGQKGTFYIVCCWSERKPIRSAYGENGTSIDRRSLLPCRVLGSERI